MEQFVITGSTPDEVLIPLGNEEILRRFDKARKEANAVDAVRDRLRDFIKNNIPPAKYGNILLTFKNAGERFYANSAGLNALKNYVIVAPTERNDDALTKLLEQEKLTVTIRGEDGHIVYRGVMCLNPDLYTGGPQSNIQIAEIPAA